MPGATKFGDELLCTDLNGDHDTIATGSSSVRINNLPAGKINSSTTAGHFCSSTESHGPQPLYRSTNRTNANVFIENKEAALQGDWNVSASLQAPPNFPTTNPPSPLCGVACGSICHDSPIITSSSNVFIKASSGGGVYLDDNPVLADDPGASSLPAQPSPPAGYENITRADVQIYDNNNDDPDPDISAIGPAPDNVRVKPDINQIATDPTPPPTLGSPSAPPVGSPGCSVIEALPAGFNWFTSGAPDFPTWALTYFEAQLSPNFSVADLSTLTAVSYYTFSTSVTQTSGYTQKQILQNLCYHVSVILEPLLADSNVPPFTITSGFRNKTGSSQHNRGQATDLQFTGFHGSSSTGTQYYNLAQYIRDNFNYDQLILEWFGRNPWIHISTNSSGHRGNVLTQVARTSYQPGLIQLG